MDARRGLSRHARRPARCSRHAAALHVVKDEDAAGSGHLGDEALGLRDINLVHFVLIPEVAHRGALLDERETLTVERDFVRYRPHIVNAHSVRLMRHVRRRIGAGVIGEIARPLGHRDEIVQLALDKAQSVRGRHGLLLLWSSGNCGWVIGRWLSTTIRLWRYSRQNGLLLRNSASAWVSPISRSILWSSLASSARSWARRRHSRRVANTRPAIPVPPRRSRCGTGMNRRRATSNWIVGFLDLLKWTSVARTLATSHFCVNGFDRGVDKRDFLSDGLGILIS